MKRVKSIVRDILTRNKYCAAILLDIEGAFDMMSWDILSQIIKELPIEENFKSLLRNYIRNRNIGIRTLHDITWHGIFMGCSQGSCLGPLLWLIGADCILKFYMNIFDYCISYADDFLAICGADTRASLERKVNDRLNAFVQVTATYELKLSEHKSLAMLFGRFLLENRHPIFKINNISIPVRTNITYLGFTLDPKFKWLEHLDSVNSNISSFTVNVAKTTRRDRGFSAQHLKIWYLTVIAKKITYGYEVWYEDLNSHGQRKLSYCQRKGLLSILRPYKSISTDALCVLCGVPPLYLELKNLTN